MGGTGIAWGNSIAVDGAGSVYTTGKFTGTGDFDPGAATTNLISEGAYDIYISKLDVSGNFLWAQRVGSTLSEYANSIALDASGNIFIMGDMYSSIADFDPGASVYNLTNIGTEAVFAAQYDNDGNFLCAFILGPGHNETYRNRHIALLGSDMYMVYSFDDASVDVDPCTPVVNLPYVGNSDIAVAKYDMSICPCNIVLAVNIISFSAERSVNYVYTEWEIADTDNFISYEVLRSADGEEYAALGVMNTDKMSFTDMEALSVLAYYKLRIINQQGNSIFSEVVSVQPQENSVITEIYPNPMSQQTTLEFDNSRKENHTLTLFNTQGQLVRSITDIKTGSIEIKRKKLTSGLYFFQLRTDTHLYAIGKLILQ
ncbi:MAG TPA: T9SS type A sorting domain-containing protein [Flavobacteriales bacterium]|nr:T9SS type A sorting domain-containing protein [Flavobacteriales bacterium]